MKNLVLAVLLAAAVAFGGLYFHETGKAAQWKASAQASQRQADESQASLKKQQEENSILRDQRDDSLSEVAAKEQEIAQLNTKLKEASARQKQLAAKPATPANPAQVNPLSEMLKNPGVKDLIKSQQKSMLGPMIDKNYKRLFADLQLTPDQAASLKDLLLNKQMQTMEQGMSLVSGDTDPAKRQELTQQIKASNDAADAQIKQLLGDDNYTQFQAYEKTMPERMAISGLEDQLAGSPNVISDTQEQQLIQAMAEERNAFKFTTDFSDKSKFNGDFASLLTEDKMNTYFQELNQLNQNYLGRAQTILSPDQASAFGQYLKSQTSLQEAGMQMAAKMFAPSKPASQTQ